MNYDMKTGLPTIESFLDFVQKMRSASTSDRFALLSINLVCEDEFESNYASAYDTLLVQKLIRANHDYMLSACKLEAHNFISLIDLSQHPLQTLETDIKKDFGAFLELLKEEYPKKIFYIQGGVCALTDKIETLNHAITCALYAQHTISSSPISKAEIRFCHDINTPIAATINNDAHYVPLFDEMMLTNHIIVYLQPLFGDNTIIPTKTKAITRLMDSKGKLLKENDYAEILERYNMQYKYELMAFEKVLKLLSSWSDNSLKIIPIIYELNCNSFESKEFTTIFSELTEKYSHVISKVILEITDTDLFNMSEASIKRLMSIHHKYKCTIDITEKSSMANIEKYTNMFENCNISIKFKTMKPGETQFFAEKYGLNLTNTLSEDRPVPPDLFQKKYMEYTSSRYEYMYVQ